jgi:hypothetical protein
MSSSTSESLNAVLEDLENVRVMQDDPRFPTRRRGGLLTRRRSDREGGRCTLGAKGALLSLAVLGCVSFAASTLYLIVAVGSHGAKLDRLMNETQTLLVGAEPVRDDDVMLVRQEQNLVLKSLKGFRGQLYELNATSLTIQDTLLEVLYWAVLHNNDLNWTRTAARAKLGKRLDNAAEAIDAIEVELKAMTCEVAIQNACPKESPPNRTNFLTCCGTHSVELKATSCTEVKRTSNAQG